VRSFCRTCHWRQVDSLECAHCWWSNLTAPPLPPNVCFVGGGHGLPEPCRSLEISKELDQQNKMLENVNADFEEAISGLDAVTKKTQELIKKSGE